jgi:hypothetical protein
LTDQSQFSSFPKPKEDGFGKRTRLDGDRTNKQNNCEAQIHHTTTRMPLPKPANAEQNNLARLIPEFDVYECAI